MYEQKKRKKEDTRVEKDDICEALLLFFTIKKNESETWMSKGEKMKRAKKS